MFVSTLIALGSAGYAIGWSMVKVLKSGPLKPGVYALLIALIYMPCGFLAIKLALALPLGKVQWGHAGELLFLGYLVGSAPTIYLLYRRFGVALSGEVAKANEPSL